MGGICELSLKAFADIINKAASEGALGAILGCTEAGMLHPFRGYGNFCFRHGLPACQSRSGKSPFHMIKAPIFWYIFFIKI